MTRTARAAYPRAVIKDRSESRNGSDPSMRKAGAGHHNWGSIDHERQLEEDAIVDEELLEAIGEEETPVISSSVDSNRCKHTLHSLFSALVYSFILIAVSPQRQTENAKVLTPEEVERARNFRKNALKGVGTLFLLILLVQP